MWARACRQILLAIVGSAALLFCMVGSAYAATFSNGSPAAAATVSSPVNLSVEAHASYGTHTPPGWYNSLDPHLTQNATLVVDGGSPTSVTGAYEWGWVYDDPDAIIYDNGYVGWVEGHATYTAAVTAAAGAHTAILTVTEVPAAGQPGTPQAFTYTWTFTVSGTPIPPATDATCKKCHYSYPDAHKSTTMAGCTQCHKTSDSPVYSHSGLRGAASSASCAGSASLCHGSALAHHDGSMLGAHTHYDLEGNPQPRAATPCATCHTMPSSHFDIAGSMFSYQDLHDAAPKPEGGYDCTTCHDAPGGPDGISPHGGYAATTNKCKVCHAVHRAEGAYYLLRADSQSDACDYCHVGGSAHSNKNVYDLNPAGTATTNGHTMGAGMVPDSSVSQTATPVTISGSDLDGNDVSEVIQVRSYDPAGIEMFRFSRHHSQSPVGTGRSGWKPVGPNSLSCFSCHQPHNAPAQVWNPQAYDNAFVGGQPFLTTGYKLLRRFPSGGWFGLQDASHGTAVGQAPGVNTYGMVDSGLAIKVPEATLTAGVNYSTDFSNCLTYTENGYTGRTPTWIAQNISFEYGGSGASEDPATVNQYTLSVWCADCHNLNIGGAEVLANEELGFKAHTERTHPAPFVGAHTGPGQCYSCHRTDLSVANGVADPAGYGSSQAAAPTFANSACTQCHYGTQAYKTDRDSRQSDFPHSGSATDMKLLGSYTASVATNSSYAPTFSMVSVSEANLDAVCIRCHPGIGVHN